MTFASVQMLSDAKNGEHKSGSNERRVYSVASERVTHARMYAGELWRAYRLKYLAANPTCGCGQPATDVAFTHRHRGCWRELLDKQNHAPACAVCLPAIEAAAK